MEYGPSSTRVSQTVKGQAMPNEINPQRGPTAAYSSDSINNKLEIDIPILQRFVAIDNVIETSEYTELCQLLESVAKCPYIHDDCLSALPEKLRNEAKSMAATLESIVRKMKIIIQTMRNVNNASLDYAEQRKELEKWKNEFIATLACFNSYFKKMGQKDNEKKITAMWISKMIEKKQGKLSTILRNIRDWPLEGLLHGRYAIYDRSKKINPNDSILQALPLVITEAERVADILAIMYPIPGSLTAYEGSSFWEPPRVEHDPFAIAIRSKESIKAGVIKVLLGEGQVGYAILVLTLPIRDMTAISTLLAQLPSVVNNTTAVGIFKNPRRETCISVFQIVQSEQLEPKKLVDVANRAFFLVNRYLPPHWIWIIGDQEMNLGRDFALPLINLQQQQPIMQIVSNLGGIFCASQGAYSFAGKVGQEIPYASVFTSCDEYAVSLFSLPKTTTEEYTHVFTASMKLPVNPKKMAEIWKIFERHDYPLQLVFETSGSTRYMTIVMMAPVVENIESKKRILIGSILNTRCQNFDNALALGGNVVFIPAMKNIRERVKSLMVAYGQMAYHVWNKIRFTDRFPEMLAQGVSLENPILKIAQINMSHCPFEHDDVPFDQLLVSIPSYEVLMPDPNFIGMEGNLPWGMYEHVMETNSWKPGIRSFFGSYIVYHDESTPEPKDFYCSILGMVLKNKYNMRNVEDKINLIVKKKCYIDVINIAPQEQAILVVVINIIQSSNEPHQDVIKKDYVRQQFVRHILASYPTYDEGNSTKQKTKENSKGNSPKTGKGAIKYLCKIYRSLPGKHDDACSISGKQDEACSIS